MQSCTASSEVTRLQGAGGGGNISAEELPCSHIIEHFADAPIVDHKQENYALRIAQLNDRKNYAYVRDAKSF